MKIQSDKDGDNRVYKTNAFQLREWQGRNKVNIWKKNIWK